MKLSALAVAGIGSCLSVKRKLIVRFAPQSLGGSHSLVQTERKPQNLSRI
jgi:hypothetical protein